MYLLLVKFHQALQAGMWEVLVRRAVDSLIFSACGLVWRGRSVTDLSTDSCIVRRDAIRWPTRRSTDGIKAGRWRNLHHRSEPSPTMRATVRLTSIIHCIHPADYTIFSLKESDTFIPDISCRVIFHFVVVWGAIDFRITGLALKGLFIHLVKRACQLFVMGREHDFKERPSPTLAESYRNRCEIVPQAKTDALKHVEGPPMPGMAPT